VGEEKNGKKVIKIKSLAALDKEKRSAPLASEATGFASASRGLGASELALGAIPQRT
jgi:hypothetical protein